MYLLHNNIICHLSLFISIIFNNNIIKFTLCYSSDHHETYHYDNNIYENNEKSKIINEYFDPTIQIVILVHPYNKVNILPYTLSSIEKQKFPKNRIRIKLITERLFYNEDNYDDDDQRFADIDSIIDQRIKLNEKTIRILKRWSLVNDDQYNDIELSILNTGLSAESIQSNSKAYWNKEHYNQLIQYKNGELYNAFLTWADWLSFIDADVILTNPFTFKNLTSNDYVVISPMLKSFNTYSNYWAAMDANGYYVRSDDYLPILERKRLGTFSVPMVHSCVFINLRKKASKLLTFDPLDVQQQIDLQTNDDEIKIIPHDDIIAFAKSATLNRIELYVDNSEIWGWLPWPIVEDKFSMDQSLQELINLELESLIEGPSFPIVSSMEQYVYQDENNFDKLGVDEIYVINLERRPERRARMKKCLNLLRIDARFKVATDGQKLNDEFLRKHGIRTLDGYVDPYHQRPMTFGEIGCFLSHYRIWEEAYRNNYSKIIVLEDDVRFDLNFRSQWAYILQQFESLPEPYDFLYLGRKLNDGKYDEETIVNELFVRPRYSYWTIGYMLTKTGIQKLLNSNPLNRMIPVDEYLPIMYGSHTNETLTSMFAIDADSKLNALSLRHLIVSPTHYVGDQLYISDTEQSEKIENGHDDNHINNKNSMPINNELNENNNNNNQMYLSQIQATPTTDNLKIQPPPHSPTDDLKYQHFDL